MSIDPDRAARQQIANLLYSGHVTEAEARSRQYLEKHPRDHAMMALLAHACAMGQRPEEARQFVLRAIALEGRRADYHALLAEILGSLGRDREALSRYERALKLRPDAEGAIAGKADALMRMGKPDLARRAIERGQPGPDDSPPIAAAYARAVLRSGEPELALEVTGHHLPGPEIPLEIRRSLWFTRGQAAERSGRLDEADEAYTEGNALSAAGWNADDARTVRTILERIFDADALKTLPRAMCDDAAPIFIVGMLRSGSTLTEQLIDAHPQATGIGESAVLPHIVSTLASTLERDEPYPVCVPYATAEDLTGIANAYRDQARATAPKARSLVDKQLGNFMHLGLIALLFPNARVIHCRRHPMDMGLSCWTQKFAPGTNPWASSLEDIGGFYRDYDALMNHWRTVLPIPMLELRYEELVAALESQSKRIIEFCGLEWSPKCLRFWETRRTVLTLSADQVRQPLYASAVQRHEAWGDRLDALRSALGDTVEAYERGGGAS